MKPVACCKAAHRSELAELEAAPEAEAMQNWIDHKPATSATGLIMSHLIAAVSIPASKFSGDSGSIRPAAKFS